MTEQHAVVPRPSAARRAVCPAALLHRAGIESAKSRTGTPNPGDGTSAKPKMSQIHITIAVEANLVTVSGRGSVGACAATTGTFTGTLPEILVSVCPLEYLRVPVCPVSDGEAGDMRCCDR